MRDSLSGLVFTGGLKLKETLGHPTLPTRLNGLLRNGRRLCLLR